VSYDQYVANKKATAEAAAAAAKKAEENKPAGENKPAPAAEDKLTDDEFKAQVESETNGMDPNKSEAWAKLRYENRAMKRGQTDVVPKAEVTKFETEIATLKQQLEAAKQSPAADPTEVTALKTRVQEMEAVLAVKAVEETKEFKNGVTSVREGISKTVEKLAAKYEQKAGDMIAALNDTSDNQSDLIEGVLEKMNTLDKTKFMRLLDDVTKANETETTLRANAKEALAKIEQKTTGQTAEQQQAAKAARDAANTKAWQTVKEGELKSILTPVEGDSPEVVAWNQSVAAAETWANEIDLSSVAAEDAATIAQRAGAYPLVMGTLQLRETQLAETEAKLNDALGKLNKFQNNEGKGGSNNGDNPGDRGTKTDDKETDFVKRFNNRVAEAQGAGVALKPA
jgi:hypothetical protein